VLLADRRNGAVDKGRERHRFYDRAKGCGIEGRPKIDEKRSDDNARPGVIAKQKEAAECEAGRWPDCGRIPGRYGEKKR